jgi:hypothetical protein
MDGNRTYCDSLASTSPQGLKKTSKSILAFVTKEIDRPPTPVSRRTIVQSTPFLSRFSSTECTSITCLP